MKVINLGEIARFTRGDKRADSSLKNWVTVVRGSEWRNFAQLKGTFRTADKVGRFVVFNVGGNKYRAIAEVDFEFQFVRIHKVMDHSQYDRGKWRDT